MMLTRLMARDLGGGRRQVVAALAVAIAPISLAWSSMFHYGGFAYLWWVLISYLVVGPWMMTAIGWVLVLLLEWHAQRIHYCPLCSRHI